MNFLLLPSKLIVFKFVQCSGVGNGLLINAVITTTVNTGMW